MIDFHSHIMPGVDDGSSDIDMTMDMLENSLSQGVEYICATPHFIVGEYELQWEKYQEKLKLMQEKAEGKIEIIQGMEIYINPDLPRLYSEKKIWGINNKKYLLIELPMQQFPIYTEKIFYELRLLGAAPILAHPERNLSIMKKPELLIDLIEQGNLAQMNAGSLAGIYGTDIKKFAEKLVGMNLIHMLGSDAHNNTRRNTNIKQGYNRIKELNKDLYNWIIGHEKMILEGISVELPEIILNKKKKGFFSFFKK
ncbi:tyrosine-protein phosphatase [Clostridium thermarum]|uniref:tyrosine-protein phosphatase n=1 Tax=Clostridium thermarum TaxID=1716543 RepID=UPI0013D35D5A|nr:CpsB/CapC family capsule biosynthesis tyrosine phosphatase [Clostridium thermarum]